MTSSTEHLLTHILKVIICIYLSHSEENANVYQQQGVIEMPGYRLTAGKTVETIILEKASPDNGWQIALQAVPQLIVVIWQRLNYEDESAIDAMNIHCYGKEVNWKDICQPCFNNGVLTGGCKRTDGPCSSCVFNRRDCDLASRSYDVHVTR